MILESIQDDHYVTYELKDGSFILLHRWEDQDSNKVWDTRSDDFTSFNPMDAKEIEFGEAQLIVANEAIKIIDQGEL